MMKPEDRSVFELSAAEPELVRKYGGLPDQVIDFYGEDNSKGKVLVLIHGGYWRPAYDRLHLRPLASALAATGFKVALIEYRRIPGDPLASLADVNSAIDFLLQSNQATELILIGHSAGGHLALCLAANIKFGLVIALAPVTDLLSAQQLDLDESAVTEFLGGSAAEWKNLDPMLLSTNKNKVIIFHGTEDQWVPIEMSRNYALQNSGEVQLIELADIGHFELINPNNQVFAEILQQIS